jgi:AcrR family transcriptional regulator
LTAEPSPTATPRSPLSRERVLAAAIELADANGLDGLTMRRLAQELGVEAMTLYYYVKNKEDLLSGMVDMVLNEFVMPAPGAEWKSALRATAISAHDGLVRHPWAANLLFTSEVRPGRLRYMEGILGGLRDAGFSAEMTHHAYHALDSHILGFTLWQVGITAASEDLPDLAAGFLSQLPRDRFPRLAEHVEWHIADVPQEKSEFEFGLDLILGGLERILAGGGAGEATQTE